MDMIHNRDLKKDYSNDHLNLMLFCSRGCKNIVITVITRLVFLSRLLSDMDGNIFKIVVARTFLC